MGREWKDVAASALARFIERGLTEPRLGCSSYECGGELNVRSILALGLGLTAAACAHLNPGPAKSGESYNPPPLSISADWNLSGRELAYALIARSDQRCENYLVGVVVQRNGSNGFLSTLSQGLGTVASLVAPSSSANTFAAGSTFLQGTQRTLNDTIFAGREFTLVYDAVKRGRKRERERLFEEIEDTAAGQTDWSSLGNQAILARITPYDLNCGLTYGTVEISRALADSGEP